MSDDHGDRAHSPSQHRFTEGWRNNNFGRVIFDATRRFEQDVIAFLHAEGHVAIRPTHLTVFRHIDLKGTRLGHLAARANMTKQGMQELVDRLESLGVIERRPDPSDRRAKLVSLSASGLHLFDAIRRAVLEFDRQFSAMAGENIEILTAILRRFAER